MAREMLASHLGPVTVAKCYRLLRQVLEAAVDDRLIRVNPCRLKGAATERTAERAIPTMAQVRALADAIDPRYQSAIWLAGLGGLRKGECLGLARRHIRVLDETVTVTVERALIDTGAHGLMMTRRCSLRSTAADSSATPCGGSSGIELA